MKVGLFVEDAAHSSLLEPLVRRLASDEGLDVSVEVRTASGGSPLVLSSLRAYARDVARGREPFLDVLIVAIDADCHSYSTRKKLVDKILESEQYPGPFCVVVPEPHIERWYLADPATIPGVLGVTADVELPEARCRKDLFKQALRDAFGRCGVTPAAGGIEYGEEIARQLRLNVACQQPDFQRMVTDVRSALRAAGASSPES